MHIIAGKAVAFKIAASDAFKERQQRTRRGASILADKLLEKNVNVLTGGTDVHLVLVDLRNGALNGQEGEDRLHEIDITVNRNSIPFDPLPPAISSGLRIGTPALATRGFQDEDFAEVGDVIATALAAEDWNDSLRNDLRGRVTALAEKYPLYEFLGSPTTV
jgi:glycine hydroxymethyltransferase